MTLEKLFGLAGRQALVTGGAGGIGRMIAQGLLIAGAPVCITSRDAARAEAAARELCEHGKCSWIIADLATPEGVAEAVKRFREKASALHILVNNAGKTWGAPIEKFPDHAFAQVMAMNVAAPFALVRELLPLLEAGASAADPARVINIGSAAGVAVQPLKAYSYGASKAAIHQLSRQLANDLIDRHINVNAILPGYFPSRMTGHMLDEDGNAGPQLAAQIPAGRLGRPEEIAGAAIWLCSRAGAYVTGAEIPVDGGLIGCR